MISPKQEMDQLAEQVIQAHFYFERVGREKKVKNLNEYVRRKINERFKGESKRIIDRYFEEQRTRKASKENQDG